MTSGGSIEDAVQRWLKALKQRPWRTKGSPKSKINERPGWVENWGTK